MGIAEDLHFDVFGAADVAFKKNGGVAKCGASFLAGFGDFGFERFRGIDDAHAAAAATESGLNDERETDLVGERFHVGADGGGAGNDGNASGLRQFASGGFIAEGVEQIGIGADEGDTGAQAGARKGGIFGEEAVAGVNSIDVFFDGEIDDRVDVKVRLHRAFACADEIRFVGFEAVQAEAVFLRIDGDGSEAEFGGGSKDAGGDLTPVQCEKFFHGVRKNKVNMMGLV